MLKSFLWENNENRNSVINSPRFTNENTDLERAQIPVTMFELKGEQGRLYALQMQ